MIQHTKLQSLSLRCSAETGVLSALGVGQYPVLLSSHPSVHTRVLRQGTAVPPADHPGQGVPAILLDPQGTAGVSLAGVLAGVSSADHAGGDAPAVSRVTLRVGLDSDVHLPQGGGLIAARGRCAPARHCGNLPGKVLAGRSGETGGADLLSEGYGLGEGQDGEVVVQGAAIVVRVVRDGGESLLVEDVVIDPVLTHQDGNGGRGAAGGAVGGSEDVPGGDESAATEGVTPTGTDQRHLPGELVSLSLHSAHDPVGSISHAAAAAGVGGGSGGGGGGGSWRNGACGGGEISLFNINVTSEAPGSPPTVGGEAEGEVGL